MTSPPEGSFLPERSCVKFTGRAIDTKNTQDNLGVLGIVRVGRIELLSNVSQTFSTALKLLPSRKGNQTPGIDTKNTQDNLGVLGIVRVGRIELPCPAWKAGILPLNYTRI